MSSVSSIMSIKYFMQKNGIAYNTGRSFVDNIRVRYFVGKLCLEDCLTHVVFNIQYDFDDNITFTELDSNRLYTGFRSTYQKFIFDENQNELIIESKSKENKHDGNYRVLITKT